MPGSHKTPLLSNKITKRKEIRKKKSIFPPHAQTNTYTQREKTKGINALLFHACFCAAQFVMHTAVKKRKTLEPLPSRKATHTNAQVKMKKSPKTHGSAASSFELQCVSSSLLSPIFVCFFHLHPGRDKWRIWREAHDALESVTCFKRLCTNDDNGLPAPRPISVKRMASPYGSSAALASVNSRRSTSPSSDASRLRFRAPLPPPVAAAVTAFCPCSWLSSCVISRSFLIYPETRSNLSWTRASMPFFPPACCILSWAYVSNNKIKAVARETRACSSTLYFVTSTSSLRDASNGSSSDCIRISFASISRMSGTMSSSKSMSSPFPLSLLVAVRRETERDQYH
ncbi:hypothetical protein MOQ_000667 [Trypanosoma cruzi marinkellei]|uniref:Uncharacterized protein n=1 Tax=Trypanosoma cruzi marinkellei TaxID=85056 RepID=K2PDY6_TRYCR|nr:hypothetical protein MOQ_000667 [Trypanosoma cruzi marinkellei]